MGEALAETEEINRLLREIARPLGRGDDERCRAVRHRAAIEQAKWLRNKARRLMFGERDRRAEHGVGIERSMLAARNRDRAELLAGRAEFMHVAARPERIAFGRAQHAERLLEIVGPIHRAAAAMTAARGLRVAAHDQHRRAEPGLDRCDGIEHHRRGRCAAQRDIGEIAGRDTHPPGKHRRIVESRLGMARPRDHAIDRVLVEAGIGERAFRGFELQRHARAAKPPADIGFADADNRIASADIAHGCTGWNSASLVEPSSSAKVTSTGIPIATCSGAMLTTLLRTCGPSSSAITART